MNVTFRQLRLFLALAETGSVSAAARALHVTQPTLSHHMKVLCDCGLVTCRKEGRWCHYTVVPEVARELASFFSAMVEGDGTSTLGSADATCACSDKRC